MSTRIGPDTDHRDICNGCPQSQQQNQDRGPAPFLCLRQDSQAAKQTSVFLLMPQMKETLSKSRLTQLRTPEKTS